jgi:hypothetical protein
MIEEAEKAIAETKNLLKMKKEKLKSKYLDCRESVDCDQLWQS